MQVASAWGIEDERCVSNDRKYEEYVNCGYEKNKNKKQNPLI